jgi:hypothetical protein
MTDRVTSIALSIALGATLAGAALPASALGSTRQAKFTIPAHGVGVGTVSCPTGERATGGGYLASNNGYTVDIGASRKVGQSAWRTTVLSYSGVADAGTVYVYCSAQAPQTVEIATTRKLVSDQELVLDASCEGLGAVQAGGFATPPGKGNVFTSWRYGKAWRVRAQSTFGETASATSYAYCAKAGKPVAREGEPVSGTGHQEKTAVSAPCAGGALPLAGGFAQADFWTAGGGRFATPTTLRRVNGRWRARAMHWQQKSSFVSIAYCS